jgi:subtilisin
VVVDTLNATGIDTESATLNGELVDLDGTESVDVDFEWREAGTDTWNTTSVQTIDASTAFEAQLTGLESGTDYEYRSVAESTTTTTRGSAVPFGTTRSGPSIDQFDVEDRSNLNWARARVDWEVSSTGTELGTVFSELIRSNVVDSELESVSGSSVAGTHDLRERIKERAKYEVRLTAVDINGVSSAETMEIIL